MRAAYRVLAFAIAAMVAVQAGAIGYAVFAQFKWIEEGHTFDQAAFDTGAPGTGAFMFHALFAGAVLLASLLMLIISFFAKIPHGVRWAVIVLIATIVQIAPVGCDRRVAWCSRTGALRRCCDGSDAVR